MSGHAASDSERVLILTATERDSRLTSELLESASVCSLVCSDVATLCQAAVEGAGAALLADEALGQAALGCLREFLQSQPPWSDLPLVVFGSRRAESMPLSSELSEIGNVTVLDRPVRVRTMLAAVQAALRSRRRQYAVRKAIESRDQFLAMLGHELRNPLGAIRLAGELLGLEASEAQREKQRTVIARQTLHLSRLVDDLLDVARVTHGKVSLQRELLDLNEVVRTCHQSLEDAARQRSIDYRLRIETPRLMVHGDRVRLEQVFSNVLTNAIKYTPPGKRVSLQVSRDGDDAVVDIVDTGIGISDEMLPQIFDLFVQADGTLDRQSGGMGLGLTLVQSLIRLHGGEVHASSSGLGQGSTFSVRLKLADTAVAGPVADETQARPTSMSLRVVIVEDNPDIRDLEEELLRLDGHRVATAADGPTGVAVITGQQPDVAFVDLGLPGYDGFEVARRVRERCGDRVRLIAVSGYGRQEDIARSTAAGFHAHLTKPVGLDQLRRAIASQATVNRTPSTKS